jgi:hypothetical protein
MHRSGPVDRLPDPYALAVRLRDEGMDHPAIARVLAIDIAAVPGLLEIADRKLAEIRAETGRWQPPNDRAPRFSPESGIGAADDATGFE